ncbi:hypothetical protein PG996_002616 [Apiospora saccharicola]|uniref:Uncharacterized protein n=1 Tax=Apiospora saccharicola TaxID=335842 RepID=A0ABR1WK02_9PEZI
MAGDQKPLPYRRRVKQGANVVGLIALLSLPNEMVCIQSHPCHPAFHQDIETAVEAVSNTVIATTNTANKPDVAKVNSSNNTTSQVKD